MSIKYLRCFIHIGDSASDLFGLVWFGLAWPGRGNVKRATWTADCRRGKRRVERRRAEHGAYLLYGSDGQRRRMQSGWNIKMLHRLAVYRIEPTRFDH